MRAVLLSCAIASATIGGCVRAPARLDVDALVKAKGATIAREDLEVQVLSSPRDVQAHLALARLADAQGRPGQALAELEAVIRVGGPIGTRWHADDRARFARLLVARGRARLARGAASALEDLDRAKRAGAEVDEGELMRARVAVAVGDLRHVDAGVRERGRAEIAALADAPGADPSWLGAKTAPVPRDRGLFGVWLWERGARRAAFEMLRDWFATTAAKGGPLHDAYLRALAWWTPVDLPPPAAADLVGPERCRFAGACTPADGLADDGLAADALLDAPLADGTASPDDAAAWIAITLPAALHGRAGWGELVGVHVDLLSLPVASLPAWARPAAARLANGARVRGPADADLAGLRPAQRLVVAAGRALDGESRERVVAALGPLEGGPDGTAMLRVLAPGPPAPLSDPLAAALGAYLRVRHLDVLPVAAIVAAYRTSPARADRVATDAIAAASDAALAEAATGSLFDVLGDPARARAAWEAAVASSAEPAFETGLALAAGRANDPDAAMIHATAAAAASGDPAVVWLELARALEGVGQHVHALEAARSAIDLAGPDTIGGSLDVAIVASRALGRDDQVLSLIERRRHVAIPVHVDRAVDDPTDTASALAAYHAAPTATAIARLWVASRWSTRDVTVRVELLAAIPSDDPRRATLSSELVALAADRDPSVARAAIAALR